ncbi:hypothetical protein C8E03_101217 [Lachnotalea glycerini]|uniref:TetR/AcrR family transcriptional regulator n=1 Tax=Lachnotalea glycerini TaxID=1763509 RepID=A0A318F116_9FIRM|nr:hypothetical protein [Lachnotalea glycerini]OYO51555.1 hypothetical protein CG709_19055 [Lachnotalea glycerini]PXV95588.1 hypothetical protein C8E03_101217 [Lachnotalea glycerini]
MKQEFSNREKHILKMAISLMVKDGFEEVTITKLSNWTKLDETFIRKTFPSDLKLKMSAMEYAAFLWVNKIRSHAESINDPNEKLCYVVKEFAFGTEEYGQSLSLYIDIWAKIRKYNQSVDTAWLKKSLLEIYNYYVSFFNELYFNEGNSRDDNSLAWLMVVLSDGIHIQSLLDNMEINREIIVNQLCCLIKCNEK